MTAAEQAAAAAVDWQHEVSLLCSSSEWRQLVAGLGGAPGGAPVAVLLQQAAAEVQRPGRDSSSGSGASGAGSTARLAEAVQQVAWEKLHTGDWHSVPKVWRDAYVAACILAAAAGLPGRGGDGSGGHAQPAAAGGEAAAVSSALWHLDMATIMGGPLLRQLVDGLIERLQRRWQQLHGPAGQEEGRQAAAAGARQQQQEQPGEPAPKRPRVELPGPARAAADETAGAPPQAAAQAAEAALLPPWSMGPRGTPVSTAELPSLEAFWRHYMSTDTPVVISGAMEDWPALERWSDPAYLVRVAGPRTVPVEVGEHYLADQWGQQLMTLQQFVQQHILGSSDNGAAGSSGGNGGGRGGSATAVASGAVVGKHQEAAAAGGAAAQEGPAGGAGPAAENEQQQLQSVPAQQLPAQHRGYLAQHPLFDQIPALAADIREPAYCCLGEGEVQSINAWFGPAGTVTPLHTDPHPNLLCQAVGCKYVRLYSPACTAAMYPHAEGMHTNSGQVDVDEPDLEQFPLFGQAPFQDCVLEAGQMLFIPPGWWHYVKSTTVSFSVSYWWR